MEIKNVFDTERGAAAVAAVVLTAAVSALSLSLIITIKQEQNSTRHYAEETRVTLAAEEGMSEFVGWVERGNLPKGRFLNNGEEMSYSDKKEDGIRKRIYLKADSSGITVYSFAEGKDKTNKLNIYRQTRVYMNKTDTGYAFKHRLP